MGLGARKYSHELSVARVVIPQCILLEGLQSGNGSQVLSPVPNVL